MKKYSNIVLNQLIDKYESSLLYRGENLVKITISFKFNRKNIKAYYDVLNVKTRNDINDEMKNLESKGYIDIIWEKYEEGNIIKKVLLNINKVSEIYKVLNRTEKKELQNQILDLIKPYEHTSNYLAQFVFDIKKKLEVGKSISQYFDITKPEEVSTILFAIDQILKQKEEILKRIFSIQLFKQSKYLESIEHKIVKIMRDYGNYVDEDSILPEENIVSNPTYIYLKGKGKFQLRSEEIDLALLDGEIAFSSRIMQNFEVVSLPVDSIITIENLTAFHQYHSDNELIIYLGGFHNQIRENLLKKIYSYDQTKPFYHWSDIDLGGFRIFKHLKEKTQIPFIPYKMDLITLKKYEHYATPITKDHYIKLLDELLLNTEYNVFKDVIRYMIDKKIRLEQEIIL